MELVFPHEKRNKKIGWMVSLGIHLLIILIFSMIGVFPGGGQERPAGIEMNFGTANSGQGSEPVSPEPDAEKTTQPEETKQEPQPEKVESEATSSPSETQTKQDVPDNVTQPNESPVSAESPEKSQDEPSTETQEQEQEQEEEEVEEKSLYPGGNAEKEGTAQSQGDKNNPDGDMGSEEGDVDEDALYGNQGGSSGASLQMAGWQWDGPPRPEDPSQESGRIVFQIKVDADGEVIGVQTLEKTVSPQIERIYKEEVQQLSFSKTSESARTASVSTGKITFIIKAQ